VRNAPTIVQNVVTYDAVVRIDNKELLLKPGMTANVQFLVSEKEDVLTIPNMALRFKPPDEKNEAQDVLRQEGNRAAPRVGARRTSRPGRSGSGGVRTARQGKIYVLKDNQIQAVEVQLGITDGSKTEVIQGPINEKDLVVIGMSSSASGQSQGGVSNPFQPSRPRIGFR
jgi:HlyD family secretion protein